MFGTSLGVSDARTSPPWLGNFLLTTSPKIATAGQVPPAPAAGLCAESGHRPSPCSSSNRRHEDIRRSDTKH